MTKTQIKTILDDYGYSFNTKIKFPECTTIYLTVDGNVYSGDTTRFEFHTNDNCELLLIYDGKEDENGEFIYQHDYPKYFVPFSIIAGFIMAGPTHMKEPYKYSLSL